MGGGATGGTWSWDPRSPPWVGGSICKKKVLRDPGPNTHTAATIRKEVLTPPPTPTPPPKIGGACWRAYWGAHWGAHWGGWHDAWNCCLNPAAPTSLSPLPLVRSLNPFPSEGAVSVGLAPPCAPPPPPQCRCRARCNKDGPDRPYCCPPPRPLPDLHTNCCPTPRPMPATMALGTPSRKKPPVIYRDGAAAPLPERACVTDVRLMCACGQCDGLWQASPASRCTKQVLTRGVVWWLGPDLPVWHRVSDWAPLSMWLGQDNRSCCGSEAAPAWGRAQVLH